MYYIGAPDRLAAIYMKPQSGQANMYYAHKDHLGSIVSLTDSAGVAVFKASYDAWGKQTVSLNTISFYRGYTGHEHLPEFGLINMNGRMYDPVMGRFLSPDNYVQAADFSQSYNRYSYCWNNPLKYSDPSGDFIFSLLAAAFFPPALPFTIYADAACWGAAFNVAANWDDIKKDGSFNKDKFWSYAGFGAANGLGAASGNIWIITATGALQSGGNEWTDNNFKYTDNILTEAGWGGITSYGFAYLTLPGNKKGLNLDGKISSYLQKSGWSQRTSNLLGSAAINFTYNLGTNSIYNKYLSKKEEDRTNWFSKAITDAALSTVFDMGFNYVENVSRNLVKQKADNLKYLDKEALKYYKGENRWDMPYEFKRYQPATPSINPIAPGGNYTLPILNIDKTR